MRASTLLRSLLVGVATTGLGLGLYLGVTTAVEVHADGELLAVRTTATDVGDLLARLEVALDIADEVEPTVDTEVVDGLVVTVQRAVTATVVVDDRAEVLGLEDAKLEVTAVLDTMRDALVASQAADALEVEARFDPALDAPVEDGAVLTVEVAAPVTVRVDGEEVTLATFAPDVDGAIADAGVTLGPLDRIDPPVATPLDDVDVVTIARVELVEEVIDVVLEHDRVEEPTDELLQGERRVATEGRDGLRRDTYEVVLVDGAEESRERIVEIVVEEAVAEVELLGTRQPPPPPPPVPDGEQVVYLTYDDGPHPTYTPPLLDLLAAYDAQATFFTLGSEVARYPDIAARIVREGHTIGNHTWSHPQLTTVSGDVLTREVLDTQSAIQRATGTTPACLRPPYGDRNTTVNAQVAELGLRMTLWDVDPQDWRRPGTDAIVDHVLTRVRPGAVILLHDGRRDRGQTVAATERLLADLTEQGYQPRALPGC